MLARRQVARPRRRQPHQADQGRSLHRADDLGRGLPPAAAWDASGHARGILAPGGWIYKTDPDGKTWELISIGYRNQYDIAFNRDGELFTYDSDMEWDMNTPWYRPTRVCHAVDGSEFGWRSGTGNWPDYYPDNLPPVVNVGPGSPTGIAFGYGAKFPAKYQDALFLCDWSYGKLYAVHLKPDGGTYKGELEEFVTGTPLPLTDIVVNPKDGAMYFTIGGRKTTSGLYRVTYVGKESTAPSQGATFDSAERDAAPHKLEAFYGKKGPEGIDVAWPHLGDKDRFIRCAARTVLEYQGPGRAGRTRRSRRPIRSRASRRCSPWSAPATRRLQPRTSSNGSTASIWTKLDEPLEARPAARSISSRSSAWARPTTRLSKRDDRNGSIAIVSRRRDRELNAELCKLLVYLEAADGGDQDARPDGQGADAGRADRIRPVAAHPEDRLDAEAARGSTSTGSIRRRSYRGGNSFHGFLRQHQERRGRRRCTDEEKAAAQADPRSAQPKVDEPVRQRQAAAVRQEVHGGRICSRSSRRA